MINLEPLNQTKLFGLDKFILEFIKLEKNGKLPNKILLSGQKGIGKSTLAYHLINYSLSKEEEYKYDTSKFEINPNNQSFRTTINKSNPNVILIDLNLDKKTIDIGQIRELILNLNKSSLNNKPRFVLMDNIEYLNFNSVNAILKVLEEPSSKVHFILINNNKKIFSTLFSRCINFRISLSNKMKLSISDQLINGKLDSVINKDLINYYFTPGNIYHLFKFAENNDYDLSNLDLKDFIKLVIKNNHYKKDNLIKHLIFNFIEFYFTKIQLYMSSQVHNRYDYFIKRISDTKNFNLDEESLFMEFEQEILNG